MKKNKKQIVLDYCDPKIIKSIIYAPVGTDDGRPLMCVHKKKYICGVEIYDVSEIKGVEVSEAFYKAWKKEFGVV